MPQTPVDFSKEARIPFLWNWRTLSSLRTVAQQVPALAAPVPSELSGWAAQLLQPEHEHLFPWDSTDRLTAQPSKGLTVPPSRALKAQFEKACPAFATSFRLHSHDMEVLLCREVSFHHDEVWSEAHAYVIWFLAMSKPMTLWFGAQSLDVKPGMAVVLDAQQLHALLRENACEFQDDSGEDKAYRVVFALGLTSLRPLRARQALGISCGPVDSPNYARIRTAAQLAYCSKTGTPGAWCK